MVGCKRAPCTAVNSDVVLPLVPSPPHPTMRGLTIIGWGVQGALPIKCTDDPSSCLNIRLGPHQHAPVVRHG